MGYTTNFEGSFKFSPCLNAEQVKTIQDLYCKYGDGKESPDALCQWEVDDNGTTLEWDYGEKFYKYIEWLHYLNDKYFKPWNIKMNGEMHWEGEDPHDTGVITIEDNNITVVETDEYETSDYEDTEDYDY
jgi:hypothetical protein